MREHTQLSIVTDFINQSKEAKFIQLRVVVALYYFNGKPPLTEHLFSWRYTLQTMVSQTHYELPIEAAIQLRKGRVTCTHALVIPIVFWNSAVHCAVKTVNALQCRITHLH